MFIRVKNNRPIRKGITILSANEIACLAVQTVYKKKIVVTCYERISCLMKFAYSQRKRSASGGKASFATFYNKLLKIGRMFEGTVRALILRVVASVL